MPANLVSVLQYGVLGLCAYMIWHVGKTISAEQKRSGQPRPGIFTAAYVFMGFCLVIGVLTAFVQLKEKAILSLSEATAVDKKRHDETVLQLQGIIKGHEEKLVEQAQGFNSKLKDASAEISQYRQEIDRSTQRTLTLERALADEQRTLADVQLRYQELDAKVTSWKDDRATIASDLIRAREAVTKRDMLIRSIAVKFDPLWRLNKTPNTNTETTIFAMGSIVFGVAGDLKAFKRQEGLEIDMPPFEGNEKISPAATEIIQRSK